MSNWGFRLKPQSRPRSGRRARGSGRRRVYTKRIALLSLLAIVIAALLNSIADRPVDWTEPCSDFEVRQGMAREHFNVIHDALTHEKSSRIELRKLRKTIWQELPLCRELVEFVSLSLQLYNDLLFAEAVPQLSDNLPDLKEYQRWYELFLRLHRK